jgi:hypothetical protein
MTKTRDERLMIRGLIEFYGLIKLVQMIIDEADNMVKDKAEAGLFDDAIDLVSAVDTIQVLIANPSGGGSP